MQAQNLPSFRCTMTEKRMSFTLIAWVNTVQGAFELTLFTILASLYCISLLISMLVVPACKYILKIFIICCSCCNRTRIRLLAVRAFAVSFCSIITANASIRVRCSAIPAIGVTCSVFIIGRSVLCTADISL